MDSEEHEEPYTQVDKAPDRAAGSSAIRAPFCRETRMAWHGVLVASLAYHNSAAQISETLAAMESDDDFEVASDRDDDG
eukprot:Skav232141  [mRNA]  locus=scaffold1744:245052:245712:- [translate_table: standard]